MSALPSPLKSAIAVLTQSETSCTSYCLVDPPVSPERETHHSPVDLMRPAMSSRPSPLTSPACTSTHSTAGSHVSQSVPSKIVPFERPAHHCPLSDRR